MNKLSPEDKEDLLGYAFGILLAGCLLMFVLLVRDAVMTQDEPYQPPCRTVGHKIVPCGTTK